MASLIHLDTHVVVWLFDGRVDLLSDAAREHIETHELVISPMVTLELQYRFEIGRVTEPAAVVIDDLTPRIGLSTSAAIFRDVVSNAQQQRWTRDPFDRFIVGHAALQSAPLLTKDRTIREHYAGAIWD